MDAATIDGQSFRLRPQGGGSDVPAAVSYAGGVATLDPTADLTPSTVYEATVAGSVEDANGNALGRRQHLDVHDGGAAVPHRHDHR